MIGPGVGPDKNSKTTSTDQIKNTLHHLGKWPQKLPQAGWYFFSMEKDFFGQTLPRNSDNRLRAGSRDQIGWVFGKIPMAFNPLPPALHFWRIMIQFFYNGYGCIYSDNRIRQRFVHHNEGVQLKCTNEAGLGNLTSFLHQVYRFHKMSNY